MEITELMIGDWVKPFGSHKGVYAKIISIESNVIGLITTGGNPHHATKDTIEPIPLTNEILEKNGWVWNDIPFEQCWTQYGLCLYSAGNGYRINCGSNVSMVIDFIHQLQHALKLCGIDKTIEL